MECIKTISLSAEQIKALLEIESADERRRVADFVLNAMENPEQVDPATLHDEHPAIQSFARRIYRRVRTARKRVSRRMQSVVPGTERPVSQSSSAPAEVTLSVGQAARYRKMLKRVIQLIRGMADVVRRNCACQAPALAYLNHVNADLSRHLRVVKCSSRPCLSEA